ncbi:MAG: hypothetical protein JWM31_1076, partial [Solirubrobacterales bacterium]|nr:hypothetical protein [Solirubrobacterales bacterium]
SVRLTASPRRDRLAGDKLPLRIATGRDFIRRVVVEADESPRGRGGFRPLATLTATAADGRLRYDAKALANVRLRVRPLDGGPRSRTVTYFVYPKFRYTVRQQGGQVVVPLTARGRGVGDLDVAMYVIRPGSRSGRRLDRTPLERTGPAGGAATLRFAPLKNVQAADYLVACVPGAEDHGLGRRDFLAVRCGRASFRY